MYWETFHATLGDMELDYSLHRLALNPLLIVLASLFALSPGCTSMPDNPWAKVQSPSAGAAQSIGKPSAGCLAGAVALPFDGPGYRIMRLSRRRFYGHPRLIHFLTVLGEEMEKQKLPPLSIGDMGLARGGPMPTGHLSHQIGLDVDVWLLQPTINDREKSFPRSVLHDKTSLDPSLWTDTQEKMLIAAVTQENVDRIFINPLIKKELCKKFPHEPWMGKLRPWWGHDDHFHARLKCAPEDKLCVNTEAIPPGDGCDSQLDWWFGPEAKEKAAENDSKYKVRTLPKLPDECRAVLQ
jgi:penicillin-insensitive murein endopeptidase